MKARALVVVAAVVVALAAGGCHHDPPPAPPIEPAPRTPIGYLLSDASELKLSVDEVNSLKELDAALAMRLAALDPQIAAATKAQAESGEVATNQSSGGGGGMRGGGMGRGMGGGGRRGGGGGQSSRPSKTPKTDTLDRLAAQRAADVRATLGKAIATLDPQQQVIAKQRLSDHDVDLDEDVDSDEAAGGGNGSASGNGSTSGNGNGNGNSGNNGESPPSDHE